MLRLLAALTSGLFICCASSSLEARPYRACVVSVSSGRELLDPGTVISEGVNDEGQHIYRFQPDRLPHDGLHILEVLAVRRGCAPAGGSIEAPSFSRPDPDSRMR